MKIDMKIIFQGPRNKDKRFAAVLEAEDTPSESNTDNKYDAVYYTKEPLPRRDRAGFPDKSMDGVDIDMKTYKTHGRPSDL